MLVASACTTGAERAGPTEGGTKAVATPTNRASTSFVMIWPREKLKLSPLPQGAWHRVESDLRTIHPKFGSMRAVVLALLAGVAAGFVPAAPAAARVARTVVKGAEVRVCVRSVR